MSSDRHSGTTTLGPLYACQISNWVICPTCRADEDDEDRQLSPPPEGIDYGALHMPALLKMPESFKLDPSDRRTFTRREIQARVEGKRLDHSVPARQQPHVSLALRDLSLGGLSALSEQPLGTGERV